MRLLRSTDASDTDTDTEETATENAADERTVDNDTTVRPTFTSADDVAGDPAADDPADDAAVLDSASHTPTLVVPASDDPDATAAETAVDYPVAGYPAADEADEPVAAPAAVVTDEPAADYPAAEDVPVTVYEDAADEPATSYETPVTAETPAVPVEPVPDEPLTATPVASAAATPAATPNTDLPLLSGDTELLTQWQRVQAEFVDDPQVAVAGAADLVEQAGQALVDALQQRQRQMRSLWDHSAANGAGTPDGEPADGASDTEQLRLMMQRYRALFNQLYQPV